MSNKEQQGTFAAALAMYQKMNLPKSTRELGRVLGIPDDYNLTGKLELKSE